MKKAPNFVCVLAVWGKDYTDLFLKIALPLQLSPGNLPAIKNNGVYQIYTTSEDAKIICQHPNFIALQHTMPTNINLIENTLDNRYIMMTNCHKLAIKYANSTNSALIFLTPDCALADGSLKKVIKLANQGIRVISTVGLRLKKEKVIDLLQQYKNKEKGYIKILPRELMNIALKHLHSITQKHIWGYTNEMIFNNLFWLIPNEGLIGRCFHLHPLMVYPNNKDIQFVSTIDWDYPVAACPNYKEHYVVTDSDEICVCELSSESREMRGNQNISIKELICFAESQANANHLHNAKKYIRMHNGNLTEQSWKKAEYDSDQILNQVFKALQLHALKLFFSNLNLLLNRLLKIEKESIMKNNNGIILYKDIILGKLAWLALCIVKVYKNIIKLNFKYVFTKMRQLYFKFIS